MSNESRAVFLSYASQDAEAARRICDALRAAGIEVWFDQSELRGGDSWDQKIRKQIKECALFVPIVSANTQARQEGYFRLEWRLADQRTHLMSHDRAFIVPVVVDETKDEGARVPDSFLAVQWTRFGSAESLDAFCERVRILLAGEVAPVSDRRPDPAGGTVRQAHGQNRSSIEGLELVERTSAIPAKIPRWVVPMAAAIAVVVIAAFALRNGFTSQPETQPALRSPGEGGNSELTSAATRSATAAQASLTEADQLVARGYAILDNFHYRRDDLAVAEDFLRRATEQAPGSARAWAARAYVNSLYLLRGWDREEKRRQDTQTFANRALALNPNDTDAMLALAYLFNSQGASVQTEALMRKAMGLRTDDPRLPRSLGAALRGQQRLDESIATLQDVARRFPRDPLVRYELGLSYVARLDPAAAIAELEAALAIQPFASALLLKAIHLANNQGDLSAARATLDQIETIDQTEDRAVGVSMWVGLLERSPERVVAAAALTARTYLEDNSSLVAHGPKAMTLALVHHVTGKEVVAQRHWQAAETLLRQRLREQPNDLDAQARLAICLARLGRPNEAEEIATRVEAILREQRGGPAMLMAYYHAGRGDAAKAMAHVRSPIARRQIFSNVPLALNPWFDPIRGQPEFERAVAEAAERRTGGARLNGGRAVGSMAPNSEPRTPPAELSNPPQADSKSVVVLPFANLSGDPEQEYFSDGLTEEILNALARERDLRVSGRASAFSFKGKGASAAEIAKALNVAQLVEGSVRKAGNRVRISVQLTRASDGFSEALPTVERELTDIFALQDEVARVVVEKLTGRSTTTAPVAVVTKVPEAYEAFLKGRTLYAQTTPSWPEAVRAFQQATSLDPNFALAWAYLGRLGAELYRLGADATGLRISQDALEQTRRLQPGLVELPLANAFHLWASGASAAAIEQELAAADRARANDPEVLSFRALLAIRRGDGTEGLELLRRAVALDPRNGHYMTRLGNALSDLGRYEEAETTYRHAYELLGSSVPLTNRARLYFSWTADGDRVRRTLDEAPPGIRGSRYWLVRAQILYQIGDFGAALEAAMRVTQAVDNGRINTVIKAQIREATGDLAGARRDYLEALEVAEQQVREFSDSGIAQANLALALGGLGRKEEALAAARAAVRVAEIDDGTPLGSMWDPPAVLARVLARFGGLDEALALVEQYSRSGRWRRNNLLYSTLWAELRKEPRFKAIAEKAPL